MSKLYEYIKSKKEEIGKDFFVIIEIEKTTDDNKVIVHYCNFDVDMEKNKIENETKENSLLSYLVFINNNEINVNMCVKDFYIPLGTLEDYIKEGKRLKRLFKFKELKLLEE